MLQHFAESPTKQDLYDTSSSDRGVSAAQIVCEALRLYPPTRRVYRSYQSSTGTFYTVAADIESTHRATVLWGDDALVFLPERWSSLPDSKEWSNEWFLPCGCKPLACPARQEEKGNSPFGLSMVGLLVGSLVAETEGKMEVRGRLPRDGEPLRTEREAYCDLRLSPVVGRRGRGLV